MRLHPSDDEHPRDAPALATISQRFRTTETLGGVDDSSRSRNGVNPVAAAGGASARDSQVQLKKRMRSAIEMTQITREISLLSSLKHDWCAPTPQPGRGCESCRRATA